MASRDNRSHFSVVPHSELFKPDCEGSSDFCRILMEVRPETGGSNLSPTTDKTTNNEIHTYLYILYHGLYFILLCLFAYLTRANSRIR